MKILFEKSATQRKDISIIIPTKYNIDATVASASKTCTTPQNVEFLIKVDNPTVGQKVNASLAGSSFDYRVIESDITGYHNIHHFVNTLSKISKGDLLWLLGDDVTIEYGDWYGCLTAMRNVFPDNIYAINTRFDHYWSPAPAISKEWVNVLGYISPIQIVDTWIRDISVAIGRYVQIPQNSFKICYSQSLEHQKSKAVAKMRREGRHYIKNNREIVKIKFLTTMHL